MGPFKAIFKIIEDNNCPLYRLEERLILSEKALTFPKDKEGCLLLVQEMTQLLFELLDETETANTGGKNTRVFTCSGCTGLIKFVRIDSEADDSTVPDDSSLTAEQRELIARISAYPLAKAFPWSQLEEFISCLRERVVSAGSYLITKGEVNEHLHIILSGEMSVEDDRVKITILREGDVCGEMSYFGNKIAKSSVKAISESKVLSISGEDFGRLMGKAASVQLFMAKLLAERLVKANTVRVREFDACSMSGRIEDMVPAELFQIFHMHQKTGALSLELSRGKAKVSFREGCIINASYANIHNQDAIFSILAEKEGMYRFTAGLSPQEMKAAEIGDFMMLLMEGVKRVDEGKDSD